MKNTLEVSLKELTHAMKVFRVGVRKNAKKRPLTKEPAIIGFREGFLSIDGDDKVAVMRASGDWQGKAEFSFSIVDALSLFPPTTDPVIISYDEDHGKLYIGQTVTPCTWQSSIKSVIGKIENPSAIDLFAMWKTQPASELNATGIKTQLSKARAKMKKDVASVAKKLADYGVSEQEISALIEKKIQEKVKKC